MRKMSMFFTIWLLCQCLLLLQQADIVGSAPAQQTHLKIGTNGDMPTLIVTTAVADMPPTTKEKQNIKETAANVHPTTTKHPHDGPLIKPKIQESITDLAAKELHIEVLSQEKNQKYNDPQPNLMKIKPYTETHIGHNEFDSEQFIKNPVSLKIWQHAEIGDTQGMRSINPRAIDTSFEPIMRTTTPKIEFKKVVEKISVNNISEDSVSLLSLTTTPKAIVGRPPLLFSADLPSEKFKKLANGTITIEPTTEEIATVKEIKRTTDLPNNLTYSKNNGVSDSLKKTVKKLKTTATPTTRGTTEETEKTKLRKTLLKPKMKYKRQENKVLITHNKAEPLITSALNRNTKSQIQTQTFDTEMKSVAYAEIESTTATTTITSKATILAAATEVTPTLSVIKTMTQSVDVGITTSAPVSNAVTTTEHDAIVKLIDLEKHDFIAHACSTNVDGTGAAKISLHDGGHDGLKKIKKKQLLDKHFLEDTIFPTTSNVDKPAAFDAEPSNASYKYIPMKKNISKAETAQTETPEANDTSTIRTVIETVLRKSHNISKQDSQIYKKHQQGQLLEIVAPTKLITSNKATKNTSSKEQRFPSNANLTQLIHATTVFEGSEEMSNATKLLAKSNLLTPEFVETKNPRNQRVESKISDIQIEIYDSTLDSTSGGVTNFKDIKHSISTTKPHIMPALPQERFTQYIIDRTDVSTLESSLVSTMESVWGKPEPAAIEIHINVSEAFGNESEDLEFSYRQPDYETSNIRLPMVNFGSNSMPYPGNQKINEPESSSKEPDSSSKERNDEILVVEIIDTAENTTENSIAASSENINPIFTFRADSETGIDLQDNKIIRFQKQTADELFLAGGVPNEKVRLKTPIPSPPQPQAPVIDRDSDTIFYISNTEVKVGESIPTPNSNEHQTYKMQQDEQRESQFYPGEYAGNQNDKAEPHRYEEDIILSPVQNTADTLKIFRSSVLGADGAPPPDVTYVGESVIEVEQSASNLLTTIPSATPATDVIIQPAIFPESVIGVPVIGELPPQIELKEVDFMPDEASHHRSGILDNKIDSSYRYGEDGRSTIFINNGILDNNEIANNPVVESSMQYGSDLIDERVGGIGFDGIEGSYPFGNPATMRKYAQSNNLNKAKQALIKHEHVHDAESLGAADYEHFMVQHSVSNLRKDVLSIDMGSNSAEANFENSTQRDLADAINAYNLTSINSTASTNALNVKNASELNTNPTERISNATALAVEPTEVRNVDLDFLSLFALAIGLAIVILPVALFTSLFFGIRYWMRDKNRSSSNNNNNNNNDDNDTSQQNDVKMTDSHWSEVGLEAGNWDANGRNDVAAALLQKSNESTLPTTTPKKTYATHRDNQNHLKKLTEYKQNPSKLCSLNASIYEQLQSVQVKVMYPNGPNGSITKMTLKNNHLIVETEERNDISRNARETTMHYNTAEKDGVFVVEVARGIDSKPIEDSPAVEVGDLLCELPKSIRCSTLHNQYEQPLKNHEEVLIHQPPAELNINKDMQRSLHKIDEIDEHDNLIPKVQDDVILECAKDISNLQTGLSQSDLSSTSSCDSNKHYAYGNQELYVIDQAGYDVMSPTARPLPITNTTNYLTDDDREPENGDNKQNSPTECDDSSPSARDESVITELHNNNNELQPVLTTKNTKDNENKQQNISKNSTDKLKVLMDTENYASNYTTSILEKKTLEEKTTNEQPTHINGLSTTETEVEHDGDESLLSLPAILPPPPPELNETDELLAFSGMTDTNQLDLLPPPPPPTILTTINDNNVANTTLVYGTEKESSHIPEEVLVIANLMPEHPALMNELNDNHAATLHMQPKESTTCVKEAFKAVIPTTPPSPTQYTALAPPLNFKNGNNNGQQLPATLTPPSSPSISASPTPPATPPAHYAKTINSVICSTPLPMVVDVNGS